MSRFDPVGGAETLLLINAAPAPLTRQVEMQAGSTRFTSLAGTCAATASAPSSVAVTLPAFGWAVCEARR